MNDPRRRAPATERNREPILAVLSRVLPANAHVLEVASGTGEHAVFFAPRLGVSCWQPSDPDPDARASIDAWRAEAGDPRVLPALDLDVTQGPRVHGLERVDAVVCINMVHIAPWSACEGLMDLAASVLGPGGVLFLYGPYKRGGAHTAPSNEAFDESLRARNAAWGVRDLEAVEGAAAPRGLGLNEIVAMPANNFSLVFVRKP